MLMQWSDALLRDVLFTGLLEWVKEGVEDVSFDLLITSQYAERWGVYFNLMATCHRMSEIGLYVLHDASLLGISKIPIVDVFSAMKHWQVNHVRDHCRRCGDHHKTPPTANDMEAFHCWICGRCYAPRVLNTLPLPVITAEYGKLYHVRYCGYACEQRCLFESAQFCHTRLEHEKFRGQCSLTLFTDENQSALKNGIKRSQWLQRKYYLNTKIRYPDYATMRRCVEKACGYTP